MTTTTKPTTTRRNSKPRRDIYAEVTNTIIAQLEQGVLPWLKPWSAEHAAGYVSRPLRHNGQTYSGINVLMLWQSAMAQGFACPIWLTYRQAQALGGQVRKGEKSSPVVYASSFTKTDEDQNRDPVQRDQFFLKQYSVFNAEQCDGLPGHFTATATPPNTEIERIEHADAFFRQTGATIEEGGNSVCYVPSLDLIRMPRLETFRDAGSHAATTAHELVHWTKHESRLKRDLGSKKPHDEGYAREELVAEMGAAFLCADLAITPELRDDHASYLDHWLQVLKADKRAIFQAASMASKAVDYLHGLQASTEPQ